MKARFGPLIVDEAKAQVVNGTDRLGISRKGVELLILLGHSAGRPVRRETLASALWPERVVSDKALSMLVVEARRELAGYFEGANPIETVAGVGYSLAVPYEHCEAPSILSRNVGKTRGRMVIAVAAPTLLSQGATELGACLRDTLFNTLGSEPALEVSPRERLQDDAVGEIAFVIQSSVRLIRRDVVLSIRCVTARDESICWVASERAPLTRAFDAEMQLCERLRRELQLMAAGYWGCQTWRHYRQSSGFAALADGQRRVAERNTTGLCAARDRFRHALALDPGCAPALVGLADCEVLSTFYDGAEATGAMHRATEYVERALALNSDLAAAHSTRGLISLAQLRFASAEEELLEAIRLDDSNAMALHWYADFLSSQGALSEAVRVGHLAVSRAPRSLVVNLQLGQLLHMAGLFDEAQGQLEQMLAVDPTCARTHCLLGLNLAMFGRPTALEHGRSAVELSPNTPFYRGAYGSVLARLGQRERALQQLHVLEAAASRVQAYAEAAMMVASTLGQSKRAIDWFRVATTRSAAWALYAAALPILAPIRDEPTFQSLVRGRGMALVAS